MVGRVLELSQDSLSVHKARGFLSVRREGVEIGAVELDDIDVVLVSSQNLMWSNSALAALSDQNIPVTILSSNYAPAAMILPISGHRQQAYRFSSQAAAQIPLKKKMWKHLVRHKIEAQAALLEHVGRPSGRMLRSARTVRSGDPANHEAQAARLY